MAITIGPGWSLGRGTVVGNGTPPGGIINALRQCAISLNSLSGITASSLGTAQTLITNSNIHFNVFAVVGKNACSEALTGTASASGYHTFSGLGFYYNSSAGNILSSGLSIYAMEGGVDFGLPEIDGKKWMAMAMFNGGGSFQGLMVWVFTNDQISDTNVVTTNGHVVTTAASIFYPDNAANLYNRIYGIHIDGAGTITSDVTGNMGWNYSNGQQSVGVGYNATNKFSLDDGVWAFVMGGKTDGNAPGPDFKTANGFGIGNYDGSDPLTIAAYWNGSALVNTNYVGFVFTGDR
jgi:hypothetical protein